MTLRDAAGVVLALALVATACSSDGGSAEPVVLTPDATEAPATSASSESLAGTQPAPDFPDGLDWLNVDRPLSLAELRGKVVILDFWTYGCVNCMHIIPDLERLEDEFGDALVVIGVHSAKFENESDTENIRNVIARYGLEHPVVNDKDFTVWSTWGAQAWPTVVLIDPAGNIVGGHSGEGIYPIFEPAIASLVDEFDATGRIDRTPLNLVLEKDSIAPSVLSFPGKVLADGDGGRLFVADTNHHRIVVADLATGEVLDVAGGSAPGFTDGGFAGARFDQPQGLALSDDGGTLYVADTANHAVRSLDLESRTVATLLGDGDQASSYPPEPGTAPDTELSSPWGLDRDGSTLYIAMAGSHQIWTLDLVTGSADWFAGNGRESTTNGLRLDAQLAQPSGVAVLPGGRVVFADSESSSIRYADQGDAGETGLLAGSDLNLFDFGDVDGVGDAARLQHPLGVVFAEGALWVADTYNSKIKRLDPTTGEIATFAGSGQGWADGADARFYEPGGLSYADGNLYVADTNNHAIRVVDIASGTTSTLVLYGVEQFPAPGDSEAPTVVLDPVEVGPGAGELSLSVIVPDGYKVNDLASFSMAWQADGVVLEDADQSIVAPSFPLSIPARFEAGEGSVTAELTVYYCTIEEEGLCLIDQVRVEASFAVVDGGSDSPTLTYVIPDPGI